MTITYADGFALVPKRCDECNRLFIFEGWWKINVKMLDVPGCPVIYDVECKNCHRKRMQPKLKALKLKEVNTNERRSS